MLEGQQESTDRVPVPEVAGESGGVVRYGLCRVQAYKKTQETIALSSGESEFDGIAKAAAMGLGMKGRD